MLSNYERDFYELIRESSIDCLDKRTNFFYEFVDRLNIEEEDVEIIKSYYNAAIADAVLIEKRKNLLK